MTGKEKVRQSILRYGNMRKVLQTHIDNLREKLRSSSECDGDFIAFQLALRSWIDTEENRLLSNQMKELDAEVIRYHNDIVSREELINFLTISGSDFIIGVIDEERRLQHRLELHNLLSEMKNQGEAMPDVINKDKLESYLVNC